MQDHFEVTRSNLVTVEFKRLSKRFELFEFENLQYSGNYCAQCLIKCKKEFRSQKFQCILLLDQNFSIIFLVTFKLIEAVATNAAKASLKEKRKIKGQFLQTLYFELLFLFSVAFRLICKDEIYFNLHFCIIKNDLFKMEFHSISRKKG